MYMRALLCLHVLIIQRSWPQGTRFKKNVLLLLLLMLMLLLLLSLMLAYPGLFTSGTNRAWPRLWTASTELTWDWSAERTKLT